MRPEQHIIELNRTSDLEKTTINGAEFRVGVSLYEFPRELRWSHDPQDGSLVFVFVYLDEEPSRQVETPDEVFDVDVGRHTGRIARVRVHADRHGLDFVKLIVDGLDDAAPRRGNDAVRTKAREANLAAVRAGLEQYQQEAASSAQ